MRLKMMQKNIITKYGPHTRRQKMRSLNKISIKKPINRESDVAFNVEPLQVVGKNEQTIEGLRMSIIIDNANCRKEYKFTFELEDGDRFVTAKEFLGEKYDTREVFVFDKDNNMKYIFEPAWAKDANGESLNSYYKIEGNSLIQVVDFDENTAFTVVADP